MTPVLILGIGNSILGDDGVGPHAVAALAAGGGLPDGTRLRDGGTDGLELLCEIEDAERLILIDAIDVGAPIGAVRRLSGEAIPLVLGRALSPHQVGLSDMLALCRLRGTEPRDVVLFGVQVDGLEPGTDLSPPVAAAVPAVVAGVRATAWRFAGEGGRGGEEAPS